jgi:cytidine deaminase
MINKELIDLAIKSMKNSYSPYSGCMVGAALLTKSGKVFTGCNVENASFSATVCAERTAVFKAVSEGEKEFSAIAIAGGKDGKVQGFMPCGVCRQVLSEFCDGDLTVLVAKEDGNFNSFTLNELLPKAFEGDFI